MIEIRKTDKYTKWFDGLKDKKTQAIIDMHIDRMKLGNFGNSEPIGNGLSELKIHYQSGFRIYYKNQNNILNGNCTTSAKAIRSYSYTIAGNLISLYTARNNLWRIGDSNP